MNIKSMINQADWKKVLVIAVIIIVSVSLVSEMLANILFQEKLKEATQAIEETKLSIEASREKAREGGNKVDRAFERTFDRVKKLHESTEDRLREARDKFN